MLSGQLYLTQNRLAETLLHADCKLKHTTNINLAGAHAPYLPYLCFAAFVLWTCPYSSCPPALCPRFSLLLSLSSASSPCFLSLLHTYGSCLHRGRYRAYHIPSSSHLSPFSARLSAFVTAHCHSITRTPIMPLSLPSFGWENTRFCPISFKFPNVSHKINSFFIKAELL